MTAQGFSFEDVLEMAARRRGWLLGGALAGLLAAYAVAALSSEVFRAQSVVLYKPATAPREFIRDATSVDFREQVATLSDRLKSDESMERLLARLDGSLDPVVAGGHGARVGYLRKNLEIEVLNAASEAHVFQVAFSAGDPRVAKRVVEEAVGLLGEQSRRNRTRQASATEDLFEREAASLEAELERREAALQEAMTRNEEAQSAIEDRSARAEALREAREKLTAAELNYTPDHPEVRRLRREVARRRAQLGPAPSTSSEAELESLQRGYDQVAKRYQQLMSRRMEATLSRDFGERSGGDAFEVLRPPVQPRRPVWPDPILLYPGGALGGMVLAVLLVAAAELRSPVFGSVRGLGDHIGLPVLASIPRVDARRVHGGESPTGLDPRIVMESAPESAVAEQYRGFLPLLVGRESTPVVLVTSASRGDGKSVTVANLAASAARDLGRRVLLIDADLRRPSQQRLFVCSRRHGLSEVLRGNSSLAHCTRSTPVPGLDLLPAGPSDRNPVSLLTDDAFLKIVEQARAAYQVVFIDAPPLLPVVDARLLRRVADFTVLVVRAGSTPRDSVVRSLSELGDAVGVIFNEVSPASYRRYYYGDAYSQYAYGEPASDEES